MTIDTFDLLKLGSEIFAHVYDQSKILVLFMFIDTYSVCASVYNNDINGIDALEWEMDIQ